MHDMVIVIASVKPDSSRGTVKQSRSVGRHPKR